MHSDKQYCLCGGVILDNGFCTICGFKQLDQNAGSVLDSYVDRAFANSGYEPKAHYADPNSAYCSECDRRLVNYVCYTCDRDLVENITAEFHPYLWEIEPGDVTIAHALGVAL
jgi:hypothetical protein